MCIWKEMQESIEKVLMNQIHFMFLDLLSDRAHTHDVYELSSLQQLPTCNFPFQCTLRVFQAFKNFNFASNFVRGIFVLMIQLKCKSTELVMGWAKVERVTSRANNN